MAIQEAMTAKDSVCVMDVDPNQAAGQREYNGRTYYCSKGCKVAFDREPEKYLNASGSHEGHGGQGAHH